MTMTVKFQAFPGSQGEQLSGHPCSLWTLGSVLWPGPLSLITAHPPPSSILPPPSPAAHRPIPPSTTAPHIAPHPPTLPSTPLTPTTAGLKVEGGVGGLGGARTWR